LEGKLHNPGFTGKAPAEVVAREQEKLDNVLKRQAALVVRLAQLRAE